MSVNNIKTKHFSGTAGWNLVMLKPGKRVSLLQTENHNFILCLSWSVHDYSMVITQGHFHRWSFWERLAIPTPQNWRMLLLGHMVIWSHPNYTQKVLSSKQMIILDAIIRTFFSFSAPTPQSESMSPHRPWVSNRKWRWPCHLPRGPRQVGQVASFCRHDWHTMWPLWHCMMGGKA